LAEIPTRNATEVNQAIRQFGTVLGVSLTFAILGDAPSAVPLFHRVYLMHNAPRFARCPMPP